MCLLEVLAVVSKRDIKDAIVVDAKIFQEI